jgi:ribosome recycling factor
MIDELKDYEVKMKKTLKVLLSDYDGIRAGRANPVILDKISVDYYGAPTSINAVATISSPEPRLLVIQPWDKGLLKVIEKAIQASDLGINPQNDGSVIRLAFPPLTEERRKELVKQVEKKGEESKVAIRAIRREAIDKFKKMQKKSEISEDDLRDYEKQAQELHDKYIKELDNMVEKKSKEILEV